MLHLKLIRPRVRFFISQTPVRLFSPRAGSGRWVHQEQVLNRDRKVKISGGTAGGFQDLDRQRELREAGSLDERNMLNKVD